MSTSRVFKKLDLGPTGLCVAEAVREYRQQRRLTYIQLEERLNELGHRIPELGLRRIEAGSRRVDVDDLMALAAALKTSPLRLLIHTSEGQQDEPRQLTTGGPDNLSWREAAAWVRDDTGFELKDRIEFWRQEIRALEYAAADNNARIKFTTRQVMEHPNDLSRVDRHMWAVDVEQMRVKHHEKAAEMLFALESQKETEM